MQSQIRVLADLIRIRNEVDSAISRIINRPAEKGHIGEFIASQLFDISLADSATEKGVDGTFSNGALRGQTVNIKYYGKRQGILDLSTKKPPDQYLVLTGPKAAAESSRGQQRPLIIEAVYLFDAIKLHEQIAANGRKLGVATSVADRYWRESEVYPSLCHRLLPITDEQVEILKMFSSNWPNNNRPNN